MQVGLTSSSLATGGAHSAAVSSSTVAPTQAVRQKLPATAGLAADYHSPAALQRAA